MDDSTSFQEGPVEHFLNAPPPAPDDTSLRQVLLLRTTRAVRRRRRLRRLGFIAALAACYAAGLGTMRLWVQADGQAEATNLSLPSEQSVAVVPLPPVMTPPAVPLEDDPDVPAVVFERLADAGGDKQSCFYRQAGDRYLREAGDVQAALRCYRQALKGAAEEQLAVAAEDNWLLVALKNARRKEIAHEGNGG